MSFFSMGQDWAPQNWDGVKCKVVWFQNSPPKKKLLIPPASRHMQMSLSCQPRTDPFFRSTFCCSGLGAASKSLLLGGSARLASVVQKAPHLDDPKNYSGQISQLTRSVSSHDAILLKQHLVSLLHAVGRALQVINA